MTATSASAPRIVLVLGDQLSLDLSSLRRADQARDVVVLAEVADEATYVRHHKKKIAFLFSAMRHFARELEALGWRVDYRRLDALDNRGTLKGEVERALQAHGGRGVIVTEPGEWRLAADMKDWGRAFRVPVEVVADTRFVASHDLFAAWAAGKKQLRMEYFYREMRRKTGLLMDGKDPVGGQWNFDHDNRKPAKGGLFMPQPRPAPRDAITDEVIRLVEARFGNHFGDVEPFWFAVTREDAERARDHFIAEALPKFGDFQDAMLTGQKFLYHSVLSHYINCGLLDPLDVCRRAEEAYQKGRVPLNAAEGFIRQIIGWREYVRGIYWLKMPDYADVNHFGHDRPLPWFYWTGETQMACVRAAVLQTKEEAYAHHIQRLMVTGNFALLAGVSPKELHEWYLAVYADAYEWVELPNTIGMSQFADGGLLASKPYAASGAYINRMSDYCKGCRYEVKARASDDACPFNALYWNFLVRNRSTLEGNPRMAQMFRTYDALGEAEHQRIHQRAMFIRDNLEQI